MSILILVVIAYLIVHTLFYRRHRRRGLSVWVSCRGPFHTRISRRF